jgi:hypothetical protein
LAYQPPTSDIFFSEQIRPATSRQYFSLTTNQHQPPAKRTDSYDVCAFSGRKHRQRDACGDFFNFDDLKCFFFEELQSNHKLGFSEIHLSMSHDLSLNFF